jgi:hypothetical protein
MKLSKNNTSEQDNLLGEPHGHVKVMYIQQKGISTTEKKIGVSLHFQHRKRHHHIHQAKNKTSCLELAGVTAGNLARRLANLSQPVDEGVEGKALWRWQPGQR